MTEFGNWDKHTAARVSAAPCADLGTVGAAIKRSESEVTRLVWTDFPKSEKYHRLAEILDQTPMPRSWLRFTDVHQVWKYHYYD